MSMLASIRNRTFCLFCSTGTRYFMKMYMKTIKSVIKSVARYNLTVKCLYTKNYK